MNRIIIIAIIGCFMFTGIMFAQTNTKKVERGVEAAIDKALREHKAEQKKAAEEARRKEREKEQRHEQLRTQQANKFNNSMNNLNQVSARDFIPNSLRQQSRNINTKESLLGRTQQRPSVVATPRTAYSKGPFGNSGNIGSPSYSGNNYTGDRYNLKPAGFSNTQQQAYVRKSAEQIRGQYKPSRTMNQGVINTRQTHMPSRASMQRSPQQDNTQNVKSAQAQAQRTRGTQKTPQASYQQKTTPNPATSQMPQKRQVPVREQTSANRIVNIDPSNGPNTGQDNSSSDLRPVDIMKPSKDNGRKAKYTAYNIPNEAHHLSDKDNKTPSKYKGAGRTIMQEYQLVNKDRMNGYASFDNRKEWENIYDVFEAGKVKTSSRVVSQKR